jgi:hypothetical protein
MPSSAVTINQAAIQRFFHDETGPLARLVARKAAEIEAHARANASNHVRSGDLLEGLRVRGPFQDPDALFMLVGSTARHPWKAGPDGQFGYPTGTRSPAAGLEYGGLTPSGTPYGPFPWLRPAVIASGFKPA